ncbi:MAG: ribose-5-phosphate isomerase RpiA [Candidatus Latescibacterota bacterium]|nr:ribose-5-phosphate isomerase RpiA [Candidatus Latescibacterota bacterium]
MSNPKEVAGHRAAAFVVAGTVVGLGTGSTAEFAIRAIGDRVAAGLHIAAIPTSEASATLARELGIELTTLKENPSVDLTIDGADEVDPSLDLIKGLGGALLREKIVASATVRQIIIVDPSKLVDKLGTKTPLPIEVVPFSTALVEHRLKERGFEPTLRMQTSNEPFVTDNGNYIIDGRFPQGIDDTRATDTWLNTLPGVVENGLFVAMTHLVVVGEDDGSSRLIEKD